MMDVSYDRHFEYCGVRIDDTNLDDISRKVSEHSIDKGYVCFNDVSNIMKAVSDPMMLRAVNDSSVSASDGMPLVWFGRMAGGNRIDRVAGFNCLSHLLEEDNGLKHFLLGDTSETIERIINKAKARNSSVQVEGYSPPFKDKFDNTDNEKIIREINDFSPDVVWVSFGGGKQEKWMNENSRKINKGVMMGVGAGFRYYIGDLTMPPKIFQRMGLQWFFRMIDTPKGWFKTHIPCRIKFMLHLPFEAYKERQGGRRKNA
jgi:N-acetylglucosaminyldiphosphoundecaprenol N-acetyl-beta-D-mannosaminyltransferase